MQPLSSQPDHPIPWAQVLDQVEEILRRTEAAAATREQAISAICSASEAEEEGKAPWRQNLSSLEEQMQQWPMTLQRAEEEARETDALLQAGDEALRRWLSAAEALERRLAKWSKPEV